MGWKFFKLAFWRRKWQSTPVLPGKSHGQRSLVGFLASILASINSKGRESHWPA